MCIIMQAGSCIIVGVLMDQNEFDTASGGMKVDPTTRSRNRGRSDIVAIDTGPYLRQCARRLPGYGPGKAMRQTASRLGAEQGPANSTLAIARAGWGSHIQSTHIWPLSGAPVWVSLLIRWARQPK